MGWKLERLPRLTFAAPVSSLAFGYVLGLRGMKLSSYRVFQKI
jgi:hypothetical protein